MKFNNKEIKSNKQIILKKTLMKLNLQLIKNLKLNNQFHYINQNKKNIDKNMIGLFNLKVQIIK